VADGWHTANQWVRVGRGRSWTFKLSTDEIIAVLDGLATQRDDAFTLLQCDRVTRAGESQSVYLELPVDALALDGAWQYFIRSRTLAPAIPANEPRRGVGWPAEFSVNGLIGLNHPDPGSTDRSALGIVHRVGNEMTREVHDHADADALFRALKRALRHAGATPA
jgi:hypothetical protein